VGSRGGQDFDSDVAFAPGTLIHCGEVANADLADFLVQVNFESVNTSLIFKNNEENGQNNTHFVIVQLGKDISGPLLTLLRASIPLSINSLSSVSLGLSSLALVLVELD